MACGMEHAIDSAGTVTVETSAQGDGARLVVLAELDPGRPLRLSKYVAYHWAAKPPAGDLVARVDRTLDRAARDGYDMIEFDHRRHVEDFDATPIEKYPLLLHHHPLELYRHQVIKQTDVVLATYLVGHHFSEDEKRRTFDYYDPLTTGDSTLSACIQSVVASEVGYPEAALEYFVHACAVDLADVHGNTADGIHIASCGGTWLALVAGFGGLREDDGQSASARGCRPNGTACASACRSAASSSRST
jgi:trehalose/maltose hydrolase-like predicted phosphorylase